jgi:hypothetical protein
VTSGIDRAIRLSTAVAVLAVAGIAAYVSYCHAYAVVRAHGETGITARLEPATIDGLVYASSMVVLYAARHRVPVPSLAQGGSRASKASVVAVYLGRYWRAAQVVLTVSQLALHERTWSREGGIRPSYRPWFSGTKNRAQVDTFR